MPDKKLTDNEIKKALEDLKKCNNNEIDCGNCTLSKFYPRCPEEIGELAFDLINRQKEEIEWLKDDNKYLQDRWWKEFSYIQAEAYKEFAERLLEERLAVVMIKDVTEEYSNGYHDALCFVEEQTNNLLKEKVGE